MLLASSHVSHASLAVPATQNTAPVLEFNCLYTHDIRRKAKRWQDGFLRFHTFNKRVMVYDVPRNLIGDTHWRDDDTLHDGDEVTLDRCGVLVQVADQIGKTETDVTGIRKTKSKAVSHTSSSTSLCLPSGGVAHAIQRVDPQRKAGLKLTPSMRQPLQEKHQSLNTLLGARRTALGKAAPPTESPFEARQRQIEADDLNDRAAKRRKVEKAVRLTPKKAAMQPNAGSRPSEKCVRPVVMELSSDDDDGTPRWPPTPTMVAASKSTKASAKAAAARSKDVPRHVVAHEPPKPQPQRVMTKLFLKSSRTRPKMLIAFPEGNVSTADDPRSQQKQLADRMARMEERRAQRHRESVVNNQPGLTSRPARDPSCGDTVVNTDNCTRPLAPVTGDDSAFDDDAFEMDMRTPSPSRRSAAKRISQELPRSKPRQGSPPSSPGPEGLHFPAVESYQQRPGSVWSQAFPSTVDMDWSVLCPPAKPPAKASRPMAEPAALPLVLVRQNSKEAKMPAREPWSREAFDLLTWRPPGWDEEKWCVVKT